MNPVNDDLYSMGPDGETAAVHRGQGLDDVVQTTVTIERKCLETHA